MGPGAKKWQLMKLPHFAKLDDTPLPDEGQAFPRKARQIFIYCLPSVPK